MSETPAGWYPDPANPLQERLWDGSEWVEKTRTRTPAAAMSATTPSPQGVTFKTAVMDGFRNYLEFGGRAERRAYLYFWLFSTSLQVLSLFYLGDIGFVVTVAFFFPGLTYMVRRLHDRGKSAKHLLWLLTGPPGAVWLLVQLLGRSEPRENVYGPHRGDQTPQEPNKVAEESDKVAAVLLAVFLGVVGGHRFYLGYRWTGGIAIVVTLLGMVVNILADGAGMPLIGIVFVWGIIDAVLIALGRMPSIRNVRFVTVDGVVTVIPGHSGTTEARTSAASQ